MKNLNIKVSEYGIKNGKSISPPYYSWDYCVQKKIPYIIIKPKRKYSIIDYDLLTIDKGISFQQGYSIINYWWEQYERYISESLLPTNQVPLRILGVVTDHFIVFKKDQERMARLLMKELEYYINKFGIIDPERKRYFESSEENKF